MTIIIDTCLGLIMRVISWLCILDTDIDDRADTLATTSPVAIRSFIRVAL